MERPAVWPRRLRPLLWIGKNELPGSGISDAVSCPQLRHPERLAAKRSTCAALQVAMYVHPM